MKILFVVFLVILNFNQAAIDVANLQHQVLRVPYSGYPMLAQHSAGKGKVLKGFMAGAHQFPYQAALFIDGTKFCGASLISKRYVLTAAHCAQGARTIDVILGAHHIYAPEPTQIRITSRFFKVHECWDPYTLINDIALILLPCEPPLSDAIQTIALPSRADVKKDFVGCLSLISGWGKNSDQAIGITETLQYVETQIITNEICALYFGHYITPSNICASGEGNKSTCNGDSGGPMAVMVNGRRIQVGVTSFVSQAGCEAGYPHAYTRVTKFLDWIQMNSDVKIRNN